MSFRVTFSLVVLGSVLGSPAAYADGVCEKGYHDTTPAELATMTTVLEAARGAVPDPPTGWIRTLNDDSVAPPTSVCLDVTPWSYSYTRHYSRVEGAEEREQAEAAAAVELRAAMAERQPRIDALMARAGELGAELGAAATSGDNAKIEAINAEMERLQAQMQQIMAEDDSTAVFEAATARFYTDLEMRVGVTVNSSQQREATADAESFTVPGALSAHQWAEDNDPQRGRALVLFGQWQPESNGFGVQTVPRAGVAPEKAHTIAIEFSASRERIPAMIAATDFGAVAALLAR